MGNTTLPIHQYKTALVVPHGMYCYRRMAQGLKCSMQTYCRFTDIIFGPLLYDDELRASMFPYNHRYNTAFITFVDDHGMASDTFEHHFEFLRTVYFPRFLMGPVYLVGKRLGCLTTLWHTWAWK